MNQSIPRVSYMDVIEFPKRGLCSLIREDRAMLAHWEQEVGKVTELETTSSSELADFVVSCYRLFPEELTIPAHIFLLLRKHMVDRFSDWDWKGGVGYGSSYVRRHQPTNYNHNKSDFAFPRENYDWDELEAYYAQMYD